ncbi:MAG: hypothetical protein ACK4NC_03435 [Candidatus Gracilibacteria bacterium]
MGKFFQQLSLAAIIFLQVLVVLFFLVQSVKAQDTPVTQNAQAFSPEAQKCSAGIDTIFAQRTTAFEGTLTEYGQFADVPTMELLIRAKTGLINLTTDAEEICQRNLSPDAPIPASQRVTACRPEKVAPTDKSPLNNTNELQRKTLRDQCILKVENIREKYENIILSFASWDMNTKKTYAYAKAIEDLNLALRSFNEDFEIVRGRLDKIIQGVNYLITGQNAGQ